MRIKWSSEAALEIANQLERTGWAIEDSQALIALVRTALNEANPDGENQVLKRAEARFERDVVSLRGFADLLSDTLSGVKRADRIMTDAEMENAGRIDRMEDGTWYQGRQGADSSRKIEWSKVRSIPMPYYRINRAPLPDWLDEMTADPQIFTFVQ